MGSTVCAAVDAAPDMELVAAVDPAGGVETMARLTDAQVSGQAAARSGGRSPSKAELVR